MKQHGWDVRVVLPTFPDENHENYPPRWEARKKFPEEKDEIVMMGLDPEGLFNMFLACPYTIRDILQVKLEEQTKPQLIV